MAFEKKSNGVTNEWIATAKGAGAMNETLTPNGAWELKEVRLHLSAAGGTSENFSIIENAGEGSAYNVVHLATDMETASDVVQSFYHEEKHFSQNDSVNFTYTNTGSRTWGLKVIYRLI